MDETKVVWSDHMRYRLRLRSFDIAAVEQIVRHSAERYIDTATGRLVAVGRHGDRLILVPYERAENTLTPVTVHVTSRQQINIRVRTGRFTDE
jgi:hypothetical protein